MSLIAKGDNAGTGAGTSVTVSVTYGANEYVVVRVQDASATVTATVTDGTNTYTPTGTGITDTNGPQRYYDFSCKNPVAGSYTLSGNFSGSTTFRSIAYSRRGGRDNTANPVTNGQYQNSPGTGTDAITSLTAVPAVANCEVVGITSDNTSSTTPTFTAGTGYTNEGPMVTTDTLFSGKSMWESKTISSTAAVATTYTGTPAASHDVTRMWIIPDSSGAASVYPYQDSNRFLPLGTWLDVRPQQVQNFAVTTFAPVYPWRDPNRFLPLGSWATLPAQQVIEYYVPQVVVPPYTGYVPPPDPNRYLPLRSWEAPLALQVPRYFVPVLPVFPWVDPNKHIPLASWASPLAQQRPSWQVPQQQVVIPGLDPNRFLPLNSWQYGQAQQVRNFYVPQPVAPTIYVPPGFNPNFYVALASWQTAYAQQPKPPYVPQPVTPPSTGVPLRMLMGMGI